MKGLLLILLFPFFITNACFADRSGVEKKIDEIKRNYEKIHDYQCRLVESCRNNNRYESRIINYYFKKPKMIRMDILSGNRPFDAGSVGVYTDGDKVRGHRGGPLKHIQLNLSKHNPLATTIRGVSIDESDMETVLQRLEFFLTNGTISLQIDYKNLIFICHPFDAEENEGITKDIVWVDRVNLLIVRNERYENEVLVQEVEWKDYIINAGLPDKIFDVLFNITELEKENIPLISQTVE